MAKEYGLDCYHSYCRHTWMGHYMMGHYMMGHYMMSFLTTNNYYLTYTFIKLHELFNAFTNYR